MVAETGSTAESGKSATPKTRTVRFRITRQDGPGKPKRVEQFDVQVEPGANVISCLQQIASNPVTVDGKKTTPVVWDANCLEEVCGACTMRINGKVRQACSCLLDEYAPNDGDVITLEPMTKFPVYRDLFVDRSRLFHNLIRIRGWVPIDGTYDLGAGPPATIRNQELRYPLSQCMSCGCCLEACPQFQLVTNESDWDSSFIGANIIGQARYFNTHETGKELIGERMEVLSGPGGISDCGNAQNCVKVCPKEIPLTEAIGAVGRSLTVYSISSFFTGK
ncbi:MAG TPA: succinate dehydrogenase iron-sulfur subunit [Phycisphaeraceae bacterium]|nr:succinate dehydrogenase iron-sulfur subunit [Phycisphaeraceae bacterium]